MSLRSTAVLIGIVTLSAAVCARLGLWQLDRLQERQAANAAAMARRALPPVLLNTTSERPLVDRRVSARGMFDHAHQVVLRGRVYRESPGVYVVTPLRLNGSDSAVLVNRGFVPAPDALTVSLDTLDEPGEREVTGIAQPIPASADSGTPLVRGGRITWKRLDLAALRARLPYPMLDIVIIETPDSDSTGFPRRLEPQPLDNGPHLSYAIQWFAFGTIALVGGAFLVAHERRRIRD